MSSRRSEHLNINFEIDMQQPLQCICISIKEDTKIKNEDCVSLNLEA